MNHRALKRIFKKALGITSREELQQTLAPLGEGLSVEFLDVVDQLDAALTDLEKMIEIRDRSLDVSSKEMLALNAEIVEAGARQKAVIEQLTVMLNLLGDEKQGSASGEESLDDIIKSVRRLIESQVRAAKNLQTLFEVGRKISSVFSFQELQQFLEETGHTIGGSDVFLRILVRGSFIDKDPESFFEFDLEGNPVAVSAASFAKQKGHEILSSKESEVIAFLNVKVIGEEVSESDLMDLIKPLLPNIATTIENIKLLKDEKLKEHLANELQTARFVQKALLPPAAPNMIPGVEVHGFYQSASECGGDWWNAVTLNDGRVLVIVGDVTGHGTASAMISAVVKGYCDSFVGRADLRPKEVLSEINNVVFNMAKESNRAMTMSVLILDTVKREIQYSNAGHPSPFFINPGKGDSVGYLVGSGNILGLSKDAVFTDHVVKVEPGARVVLYSDGLIEATNPKDEMYGDRRLFRLLKRTEPLVSSQKLSETILNDHSAFAQGVSPADDITTVIVALDFK